jgi:hypothetical protein
LEKEAERLCRLIYLETKAFATAEINIPWRRGEMIER